MLFRSSSTTGASKTSALPLSNSTTLPLSTSDVDVGLDLVPFTFFTTFQTAVSRLWLVIRSQKLCQYPRAADRMTRWAIDVSRLYSMQSLMFVVRFVLRLARFRFLIASLISSFQYGRGSWRLETDGFVRGILCSAAGLIISTILLFGWSTSSSVTSVMLIWSLMQSQKTFQSASADFHLGAVIR